MKMHSTGLLETLLVMQCTQSHMGSASADKGPNRYRKRNSKKVFPSNVVSANGWYKFIVGFEDYVMHHLMTLKG